MAAARSDDIASLKGVVIDWINAEPYNASTTAHPLARNSKTTRGYNNPVIGALLCPTDLDWANPVSVSFYSCITSCITKPPPGSNKDSVMELRGWILRNGPIFYTKTVRRTTRMMCGMGFCVIPL